MSVCLYFRPIIIYHRLNQGSDHDYEGKELEVHTPETGNGLKWGFADFPSVANMTGEVLSLQWTYYFLHTSTLPFVQTMQYDRGISPSKHPLPVLLTDYYLHPHIQEVKDHSWRFWDSVILAK